MTTMTIDKGYFTTREEALDDIRATGYWPTTVVTDSSPELPIHQHHHDVIAYVMEGEGYMVDEHGERVTINRGDRLVIPAWSRHAEGEVSSRVVFLVTTREPIPLMKAIAPRGIEA